MESLQRRRYEKIFWEKFYLLEKKITGKNTQFCISGSTANIYTITINFKDKDIFCNCPDMKNEKMCEKEYICKHCCFILFKVLKCINVDETLIFINFHLSDDEIKKIKKKIKILDINLNEDFVNLDLLNKYKNLSLKDKDRGKDNVEGTTYIPNDTCIICFEDFLEEKTTFLICPECRNIVHKKCIEKWINMGKKSCVYCRAKVWKNYSCSNDYKNLNSLI